MAPWLVILISILLPLILVPLILPSLVKVAKRKHVTDSPNYRKFQRRPVSLLGGLVVVSSLSTALACASLYVPLNDLFPAMCMTVLLMTVGLIDDILDLSYLIKLIIQVFVIAVLCFAGSYRITSFWSLFGINELPLWFSYFFSIFIGVSIINAINFIDGIDGLAASFGLFFCINLTVWCWHHNELSHAIFSLIWGSALFAFWLFNCWSNKYKIYLGDSGSLVLGLFIYLSICKILSHQEIAPHTSDGYEFSFALSLIAAPTFDFLRVIFSRLTDKRSAASPDRNHLHHLLVDIGFTPFRTSCIIIKQNIMVVTAWGILTELHINPTIQFFLVCIAGIIFINGPAFYLHYLRIKRPHKYHYHLRKLRARRIKHLPARRKITTIMDHIPTLIR